MALTTLDFLHGVDMTGVNPVTAADLNSLIDQAVPIDDGSGVGKGLVITTFDTALNVPAVPDAATTTKWKRYLWKRVPYNTATDQDAVVYAWSDGMPSVATFLRWTPLISSDHQQVIDNTADITELKQINKDDSYIVSITAGASTVGYNIRTWDYVINYNRTLLQDMGAGIIKCLIGGDYLISGFASCYLLSHMAVFQRVDAPANLVAGTHVYNNAQACNTLSTFNQPAALVTNGTYRLNHYIDGVDADGRGKIDAAITAATLVNPVMAQVNFKRLS